MKKLLAITLALLAAVSAFAEGEAEIGKPAIDTSKTVTVTGTVSLLQESRHATITSGSDTFELRYPRMIESQVAVKNGDQITVTGFVDTRDCDCEEEDKTVKHLFVTKATIGGKEYDLGAYMDRGGRMGRGLEPGEFPRRGMMGR